MTTNGRTSGGTPGDAERDPRLDRLYRETVREEPPARLAAAILAAARREVGARPRAVSPRLRAWRVPVSIAAVVVLSVTLVTLVREEGGGKLEPPSAADRYSRSAETAPVPPAAVSPDTPEAAKAPAATPAARDDVALGATASAKIAEEASRPAAGASAGRSAAPEPQAPPRAAAPAPQPFQAAPAPREQRPVLAADQAAGAGVATQSAGTRSSEGESSVAPAEPTAVRPSPAARMMQRDRAAASEAAGSMSAPPPPAASAPAEKPRVRPEARAMQAERPLPDTARVAGLLKEFEPQPPEKWLEKIEALKREERKEEADGMLAEFKRRFPNHPLPPGLR
jgi:hypothetical protein